MSYESFPHYLCLLSYIQAYAVIAKGVRLLCTNTTGKNTKAVVLKTQGSGSLKDNIITVFGMSTFSCLQPVSICISDSCKVDGFISKPGQGSGRNLGDRQYYFVNGRPVDMPKVTKLVNELYKGANSRQYPIAIMSFSVPSRACDVNVTPDKRKIFFSDESSLLLAIREGLQQIYSPSNVSFSINKYEEHIDAANNSQLSPLSKKSHVMSEQFSAVSKDRKEIQMEEDHVEESNLVERVEINSLSLDVGGTGDKKCIMNDFALRVHGTSMTDKFSKSDNGRLTPQHDNLSNQCEPSAPRVVDTGVNNVRNSNSSLRSVQSTLSKFLTVNKRNHEDISISISEIPILRNQTLQSPLKKSKSEESAVSSSLLNHYPDDDSIRVNEIESSKFPGEIKILDNFRNSISCTEHVNDEECKEVISLHHFNLYYRIQFYVHRYVDRCIHYV